MRKIAVFILAAWTLGAASPPAPRDILGFTPGDDYKLADYAQIMKYFQALAAASDRMRLVEIGKSELGKPLWMAYISTPENLKQLDKYRRISERLALGKAATEAEAAKLAAEGKAIVWIDSGLHASEVATAQHAPELAYKMVAGEGAELDKIRRQVILLQIPSINPDGLDWIAHWYMGNVGTPYEGAPLPWLYHKYAGHDNNRDWFMMNLAETRHASRVLYHEWFPQILYNHHQAPPFPARIFVPPYDEPLNPHIPSAVMEGVGLLGLAMGERFAREGKTGVVSYKTYDAWWNGGLRSAPAFHNIHGLLTETALYSYATPHTYTLDEIPHRFADGLSARDPSIFYQRPFLGGKWGLRAPIEYMLTADLAVLTTAADRAADFLLKSYQMARASIEAGAKGNPYAYVLAPDQWDRPTSLLFLQKLALGGVEIHRARAGFTAVGKSYPAGTYVLPAAQPFRPYLMDLVEPQKYPELRAEAGRPTKRPYDIAGWTLSQQMGVKLDRVDGVFAAQLERVKWLERIEVAGSVEGGGAVLLLDHRQNAVFPAMAELLKAGAAVRWAGSGFEAAGKSFVAGTVIATGGGDAQALAAKHGLDVTRIDSAPPVAGFRISSPKVGLYQPWLANADQGWTEWLFDTFHVPYTLIHNEDFRKPDLRSRFDTIVLASQTAPSILHGFRVGEVSAGEDASRRGPQPPANQRPEYAGGIGPAGLYQLEEFVRQGGALVALEEATELPVSYFPLSLNNRARGGQFYCPGSLLRITVDPSQPLSYGMPREAIAFSSGGAAFQITVAPSFNKGEREIQSAARFASRDLLASGWVSGERAILGREAVVEAHHGKGKIILIAFRPQFRGQPHGTFKFLLNAAYLGSSKWENQPAGR
ncbi:MAG: peptidase M14 [Acidobacteria bacterium]|nr:peptidase M14 [Acidobacteriota bacterium]